MQSQKQQLQRLVVAPRMNYLTADGNVFQQRVCSSLPTSVAHVLTCTCPLEPFAELSQSGAHALRATRGQLIQRGRQPLTTKPGFIDELCVSKPRGKQEFTETLKSLSAITGIFFNDYHSSETARPVLKLIQVCSFVPCVLTQSVH